MKFPSGECHKTSLMISQYCFRQWLGVSRQHAITCGNLVPVLCHLMVLPGPNELNEMVCLCAGLKYSWRSLWNVLRKKLEFNVLDNRWSRLLTGWCIDPMYVAANSNTNCQVVRDIRNSHNIHYELKQEIVKYIWFVTCQKSYFYIKLTTL